MSSLAFHASSVAYASLRKSSLKRACASVLELLENRTLLSSYYLSGPDSGEVARASTAFTVTLDSATISGTVRITPAASNGEGVFSPAYVDLTNTTRSATFTYTPAKWDVRMITVTNNGGLTNPSGVTYLSKVQTGNSGTAPSGDHTPDFGGFNVFANGAWWQELAANVRSMPVDPNNAAIIAQFNSNLYREFGAPSGITGGFSWQTYGGQPINVVAGTQAAKTVYADTYYSESDVDQVTHAAQVPVPANPVIEGWYSPTGAFPTSNNYNLYGDAHMIIYVRNESTGGIDTLWELYRAYTTDNGVTWHGSSVIKFDLTTGAQRHDGWTSTDAAGLPVGPLNANYSEVAAAIARGDNMGVGHPIRMTMGVGKTQNNTYVWPAKHAVGASVNGLFPMGARLRLTDAWYQANKNSFGAQARAIVDTLYQNGVIIADIGSNNALEGMTDDRWIQSQVDSLGNIPNTAFEAIRQDPFFSVTGPTSGSVGSTYTFTLQMLPASLSSFGNNMYSYEDGTLLFNPKFVFVGGNTFDDSHRTLTVQYTPDSTGAHTLQWKTGGEYWKLPSTTFTATSAGVPAAPSGLSATAASSSQINLSWTDNANNESGFYIDRAIDSGFSANLLTSSVSANVTSYSASGLSASTTYYFRVRSYNGSGSSANSNTASATTQASGTSPNAPTGLSATAISQSQINLSWTDASGNEDGFYIDRAMDSGFSANLVTSTAGVNVTSYSAAGLSASTTYYFRVRAYNANGSSANTTTASATTAAATGPTLSLTNVGTGINQVVTVESQNQFRLVFAAGDNWGLSKWYDLVNDPGATTNLTYCPSVNPGDPGTDESGLFNMVWYGTSPNDPKLSTQAAKYYQPNAARSFTIDENSSSRIVVTSVAHPMLAAGVLNNLTVTLKYYIYPNGQIFINSQMTAVNAQTADSWRCAVMGLSDPSNNPDPNQPTDTSGWIRSSTTQSPYNYNSNIENYIYAFWSHSTGGGYANWTKASIMLVPDPANTHMTKQGRHSWNLTKRWFYGDYNALSMTAGQTITQNYMIQLGSENSSILPNLINSAACDSIANAYRSNPTPPLVGGSTPNAPSGLAATAASSSQINVSWADNSSNESGFYIDRATDSGFTANLLTNSVGANVTTSSATGLSTGTTYYFRVRAYNAGGASANSTTASATTVSNLPSGWSDADVGSPSVPGSASYNSGTWTINGNGLDIWDASDQFNFAYEGYSGDGVAIARVTSLTNTSAYAKAGVMFRDSPAANAACALVNVTPGWGVEFIYRTSNGAMINAEGRDAAGTIPMWVKLVRSGNIFTGYDSTDGVNWLRVGAPQTITMAANALAGLAVNSQINGTNATGVFSNVSISGPNQAPTDISLSASSITENQPSGTAVGTISTTDPDAADTFAYSLVSGTGSMDNASFTISGDQLLTAVSFDFETKSSYSIRIRTTDQGGLWYEKAFTITVTDVDEIAPTVTAVYVRGSTWNTNYLSFLAANMSGSSPTHGYAIPVGSGSSQLQTLPWRNLNQISIAFSENVSIAQAQFAIVGSVGSYSVSGFSYNATDHVATWTLSSAIGPDKVYVAVPGSGTSPVQDAAGNTLDGEWSNPSSYSQVGSTSSFPSGNGVAGGDFAFRFDVLPGDSTGGSLGKVNVADVAQTKSRSSLPVTVSTYRSDFDGNNLVNVADVAYVKSKSSIYSLPVNPPVPPTFGLAFSQVSVLLSREYLLLGYVGR